MTRPRRQRGFTIVELIVGLLMALVSTIVIFQVFATAEGRKRTQTSAADAQSTGAIAAFSIERDLRMAGYGLNFPDHLGCTVRGYDERFGGATFNFVNAPVLITPGVAGASDSISVFYGAADQVTTPPSLITNMASRTANFDLTTSYGFRRGEVVLVAEVGRDCSLAQASSVPTTTARVEHLSAVSYVDPETGAPTMTRYNDPAGVATTYTVAGRLYNLGYSPQYRVYSVASGQLAIQDRIMGANSPNAAGVPFYDGIVRIAAQYGKDTNSDGAVDQYDIVQPTTAALWRQVVAVRFAVVARSGQLEREAVSPATLTLLPALTNPVGAAVTWTLTSAEQRSRYKVYEVVVPLRNMVWTPQ